MHHPRHFEEMGGKLPVLSLLLPGSWQEWRIEGAMPGQKGPGSVEGGEE